MRTVYAGRGSRRNTRRTVEPPAAAGLPFERVGDEREYLLGHGIAWRADVVVEARVRGLTSRDDLHGNPGGLERVRHSSRLRRRVRVACDVQDQERGNP